MLAHETQTTNQQQHTCLFLDTFYDRFLANLYESDPNLQNLTYQQQLQKIIATNNGDSDFYSGGLRNCDWQAQQIVINSPQMQATWARENGSTATGEQLLIEQVARIKPAVVYCQDMHQLSAPILKELKKHCQLLVGQIATSIIHIPIECYDVIVSSILPIVEHCRSLGITAFYVPLAFAKRVTHGLNLPAAYNQRTIDCSFVGSIASDMHLNRVKFLTYQAQQIPLQVWGVGAELLPIESPLRACYRGQAWGPELFSVLGNSKITVNCHGEVLYDSHNPKNSTAEFANNMRLYEATGMGALLITEYRRNLSDLFELGKEVLTYQSEDECAALIKYYLQRPNQAAEIAAAGQARTLREHSYEARMQDLSNYLKRLLTLKNFPDQHIDYNSISCDFKTTSPSEINQQHLNAWKNNSIPHTQRALVNKELRSMYSGQIVPPFKSLQTLLNRVIYNNDNVLEIGCSSGYYYEVLNYLIPSKFTYTGVDYSEAMINMAKTCYPSANFVVASGDALPFTNQAYDLVISGCILLHCPNYIEHIVETARVTKRSIILARTPVCRNKPTSVYTKKAYGVETVELLFNEAEIVQLVKDQGFRLTHYVEVDSDKSRDQHTVSYAFIRIDA